MTTQNPTEIRTTVRESYGEIARSQPTESACCGSGSSAATCASPYYESTDLSAVPEGADLGLGSGNPIALGDPRPGEIVLDLGSGAGIDTFLAATRVGETGYAIGVDMTPDMLDRARKNAEEFDGMNVEFRLGEIENLPVPDETADVVISNCVVNLSPDKPRVFREAFRALKPGGRLAISDIVAKRELPAAIAGDVSLHCGCVGGAATSGEIRGWLENAGFEGVRVTMRDESPAPSRNDAGATDYVTSATIEASKPA